MYAKDTAPIYLDYQSTTPIDPRVLDAINTAYQEDLWGNPHSLHFYGVRASKALDQARSMVATLIGARPSEIVFTSGATESNNLIFKGLKDSLLQQNKTHIVTTVTEHKCVLESVSRLSENGFTITILPVDEDGNISLESFQESLTTETGLVSIMTANNEIGTLHPINDISEICQDKGILLHTDAAQAVGKIPFNVNELGVDFASISSHKMYGPAGVGALFAKYKHRNKLKPLLDGGGQENGRRSGTVPTALCIGFGKACEIAAEVQAQEAEHLLELRELLLHTLLSELDGISVNGTLRNRLPGNLNISFSGVDAEALLMKVRDELSISSGSACNADSLEPSYVIKALGLPPERAEGAIRLGFGRFTTRDEVRQAAQVLIKAIQSMRPIYSANVLSSDSCLTKGNI